MVTIEFKQHVIEAIQKDQLSYSSAAKQATSLGINAAQLSRICKGDFDQVITDAKWRNIGRRLGVSPKPEAPWVIVETPVFTYVQTQLSDCQENSISGLLCDYADIGKTIAAKEYAKENKFAWHIDCSQTKTKQKLIRKLAQEVGVDSNGKYADVYGDLVYYLQSLDRPLIILDEAGDLEYAAFLELKALWNATEGCCAWYLIGADGLEQKIKDNKDRKKVGYAEIFSRFGGRYQKAIDPGKVSLDEITKTQVALITRANHSTADIMKVYVATGGSLRRISTELKKLPNAA